MEGIKGVLVGERNSVRDSAKILPAVPCYGQSVPDGCAFIKMFFFFYK